MKELLCSYCGFKVMKKESILSKYTGDSYCKDLENCHRKHRRIDLTYGEIVEFGQRFVQSL